MKSNKYPVVDVLGIEINKLKIDDLNLLIEKRVRTSSKSIIAHHNLHSIYLYHRDKEFRSFFELAEFVHADGMPIITWARVLGKDLTRENRITYLDWIHPLLQMADSKNMRIFYLGSEPGIAEKAVGKLKNRYTNIHFGVHHGFFDVNDDFENDHVSNKINSFEPNILMVGMGMPRQEIWIKNNYEKINVNVILPCGACFDYIAGKVKTPPRWMGQYNVEWVFRLADEPKRLFYRYCIEPLYLLPHLLKDVFKKNK